MLPREAHNIVQTRLTQFDSVALIGPRQVGKTNAGAEIDLVLEFAPGKCWAIEIKLSSAPTADRGFYNAANDIGAERRILVHKGKHPFPMRHGIEAMPLLEAVNEVSAAVSA